MSDEPRKTPPDEQKSYIRQRYQPTGGSARRQNEESGLLRRVRTWAGIDAVAGDTPKHPDPNAQKMAVELILPPGESQPSDATSATSAQRLILVGHLTRDDASGLLTIHIAPTPANGKEILDALSAVALSGEPMPPPAPATDDDPSAHVEDFSATHAQRIRSGRGGSRADARRTPSRPAPTAKKRISEARPAVVDRTIRKRSPTSNLAAAVDDLSASLIALSEEDTEVTEAQHPVQRGGAAAQRFPRQPADTATLAVEEIHTAHGYRQPPADDATVHGPSGTPQPPILAVDFGTAHLAAAVQRETLSCIADPTGQTAFPALVAFPAPGEVIVGHEASERQVDDARWTVSGPRRLLGRAFKEPLVARILGGLALPAFAGHDTLIYFRAHGKVYSASDVCVLLLKELRQSASAHFGGDLQTAVFSVPAGSTEPFRKALKTAAAAAGFNVISLLNESSAALLAHGLRGGHGRVAVYNFGASFSFTLVDVAGTLFTTVASGSNIWLGGDEIDRALATRLAGRFWNDTGVDIRTRAKAWHALLRACQTAKETLGTEAHTDVCVPDVLKTTQGSQSLAYAVTRQELEQLTQPVIAQALDISARLMAQAGFSKEDVYSIVLTGGTSLIPAVQDAVADFYGKTPVVNDPTLAVLAGTARWAAELEAGGAPPAQDSGSTATTRVAKRLAHSIGAQTEEAALITLFRRDVSFPATMHHTFHTHQDKQTEMVVSLFQDSDGPDPQLLGQLRYRGLLAAPAGEAQIHFAFALSDWRTLHVTAEVEGKTSTKTVRL